MEPPAETPPSPDAPPPEEPPVQEPTAAAPSEPVAADAEPETVEVWRIGRPPREPRKPRGAGRQRNEQRGEPRSADGEEKRGFAAKSRGGGKGRHPRKEREDGRDHGRREAARNDRPRPPRERPVDPDSPFAALQALKKDLEKSRE